MIIHSAYDFLFFDAHSGGHSGVTIVPLLSQTDASKSISGEEYKALVNRIQFGGDGAFLRSSQVSPPTRLGDL